MALADDQQFCLRWNNFQANITSQFEALRDDEDFTDVTIACEGQRMQAHKVVLSACSPFFKELFKTNPCSHPIIFMRDVEARHIVALMEFMYAGEVNVAQAHLSAFLKTAESLKIRGLTDTSAESEQKDEDTLYLNPQPSKPGKHKVSSSSTVTSSQDVSNTSVSSPPSKRQCKSEPEVPRVKIKEDAINPFALQEPRNQDLVQPKMELPDYLSDDDGRESHFYAGDVTELPGGMEIIPQVAGFVKEQPQESAPAPLRLRRRRSSDHWPPEERVRDKGRNRLIKLGEGIEIYEDQLRSVKWNDYRKLTRGLATILFSPAELATCSVTGQRWSRAGSGERPVKPALDRSKVQAIISYVATRFPMVEISRIKQVLAYKCKENSTAFKMKAVRYYEDQHQK
ncbi:zinc finger and BTB domain-containing protein 12 isoform X1 [Tribolium castaneum]|uniref:zinc finger and BTB domain-containing protein 12 isoform X1 n=1 Tax=Tribolium castaneum TaxID=7070 RepID=UPI00046BF3C7|nr:PREDICTED: zinc finger and BTB domain-containing protein 12 isoform X1 [Tribolium castaneum]XP_015839147.1 PREDICTED: zinc finger and BTB domain-containing protein 12 isoform X1 [Tribolium castaneum]|eukprot:XP_008198518.1 PREDICTED: zinc finger and BTB domain-containing protein 12 isoform X1 [Tribolium castaneum]